MGTLKSKKSQTPTSKRPRIFKDNKKLQEMLTLRKKGWSATRLANKYKVDHTTILYHCEKQAVTPVGHKETIVFGRPSVTISSGSQAKKDKKVKNYKDYIIDALSREKETIQSYYGKERFGKKKVKTQKPHK